MIFGKQLDFQIFNAEVFSSKIFDPKGSRVATLRTTPRWHEEKRIKGVWGEGIHILYTHIFNYIRHIRTYMLNMYPPNVHLNKDQQTSHISNQHHHHFE